MTNIFLISMPGGGEWILILLIVVLLFGGRYIPKLMKGIGEGMKEFNDAKKPDSDNQSSGVNRPSADPNQQKQIEK